MSGKVDTAEEQLRLGVGRQLARLEEELQDLEECRDALDAAEYEALRSTALQQRDETRARLDGLGGVLGTPRTAPAARLLGRDDAAHLRNKVAALQRRYAAGDTLHHTYITEKVQLLQQLSILCSLTDDEGAFLTAHKRQPSMQPADQRQNVVNDKMLEMVAKKS